MRENQYLGPNAKPKRGPAMQQCSKCEAEYPSGNLSRDRPTLTLNGSGG